MSDNPFLRNFPVTSIIKEPRDLQVSVLEWLWANFPSAKRFKLICPVGSGKSALALAIARYAASLELHTLISSPLNELVNQYDSSFAEIGLFTLKGRRNYVCMAGRKHAGAGYCRHDECSQGLDTRQCKISHPPEQCSVCKCNRCVYPPLIKRFRGSEIANTNFSMFLLGITNNPDVVVIDEADMIESFVQMHYSVVIEGRFNNNFDVAINELKEYRNNLQEELNELKANK